MTFWRKKNKQKTEKQRRKADPEQDIDFAVYQNIAAGQASSKGTRAQTAGMELNNNQKLATLNMLRHLDD